MQSENRSYNFGHLKTDNIGSVYYARRQGKAHSMHRKPCQDYCFAKNIDDNIQFTALADGHGGEEYPKSDRGSVLACEVLFNVIKSVKEEYFSAYKQDTENTENDSLWLDCLKTREFKVRYISEWRKAVLEDYSQGTSFIIDEKEQDIVKKYGTTIMFSVAATDAIVLGQLGDGAILLFNDKLQNQLFKRHEKKTDSSTHSLISYSAEFSFVPNAGHSH